jgi:hypothetical protein
MKILSVEFLLSVVYLWKDVLHSLSFVRPVLTLNVSSAEMFAAAQKTQELWMWKMEYLHHEQRPLYFGEWF